MFLSSLRRSAGSASAVLQQLVVGPDGQFKLEENAVTKQFASFMFDPATQRSGQISVDGGVSYQTTQFHLGYDGSPYLVAREITAGSLNPYASLFLATPSGTSDQQEGSTGSLNFQLLSGADQNVLEVVAVNSTTAMVKAAGIGGQPRWLSYSSASGLPNGGNGLLLPLDTASLFWWNKPTGLVAGTTGNDLPINSVNAIGEDKLFTLNVNPSLSLNLYGKSSTRSPFQSFASYNIPALFPVQPSAQRYETTGESVLTPLNGLGSDFILSTTADRSGVIDHVIVLGADTPKQLFSTYVPGSKIGNKIGRAHV